MSAKILRDAAAVLLAEADKLDGKPVGEVERERIRQALERQKPHEWRDWTGGDPSEAGDNSDTPDTDAFMRAFQPMMNHAGMERFKDSTGEIFFAPNIRKRGGWPELKKETLRMVTSAWGQGWMAHPLNAGMVPKPEAVAKLTAEVMG